MIYPQARKNRDISFLSCLHAEKQPSTLPLQSRQRLVRPSHLATPCPDLQKSQSAIPQYLSSLDNMMRDNLLLIFSVAAGLITIHLIHALVVQPSRNARKAKALGCGPVPMQASKLPLGIGAVLAFLRNDRAQRAPDYLRETFDAIGRYTFQFKALGYTHFFTAEPRNVQALLATQFNDFVIAPDRRMSFRSVTGSGIFVKDGAAWHSARELMRPMFIRETVSDLALLEAHVQMLLKCIENPGVDENGWTKPTSLGRLFPCLTMDSSTELFMGRSTHSLDARLRGDEEHQDFRWALERSQYILNVRLRLQSLYWLYARREVKKCKTIMHAFVDKAIDAAEEARAQRKDMRKYDYLEALRRQPECLSDRNKLREEVLSLLAAGRNTTAAMMSWVFYCLIRDPRVWAKLRKDVLDDFGPYSADTDSTLESITFKKLKGCSYLQHVLNETLRVHSVVLFNLRMAVRDTTLPTGGGPDCNQPVFIPAGTTVMFSPHVMHLRKDLWGDDADKFLPERWEGAKPGWNYLPFNGGPRICLGQQFALTMAGYVVVRMLQRFDTIEGLDVDPTRDYHHFALSCSPGTPDKDGAAVKCRLRVAEHSTE